MQYLHSSPIRFHGRLTSHNCLIDNRWTCKITDYGLRLFKASGNKLTENVSGSQMHFLKQNLPSQWTLQAKFIFNLACKRNDAV